MFRQNISSKFSPKSNVNKPVKRVEQSKDKQVKVVKLLSSILTRLSKEILERLKIFNKITQQRHLLNLRLNSHILKHQLQILVKS